MLRVSDLEIQGFRRFFAFYYSDVFDFFNKTMLLWEGKKLKQE